MLNIRCEILTAGNNNSPLLSLDYHEMSFISSNEKKSLLCSRVGREFTKPSCMLKTNFSCLRPPGGNKLLSACPGPRKPTLLFRHISGFFLFYFMLKKMLA